MKLEDFKPGMYIGIRSNLWRDEPPMPMPYVITAVGKVTVSAVDATHIENQVLAKLPRLRPSEVEVVFPDLETGKARCEAAYAKHTEIKRQIEALQKEQKRLTSNLLRGE